MSASPFRDLQPGHYRAILADPPWRWESWGRYRGERAGLAPKGDRTVDKHYETQDATDIQRMPVIDLAAADCVLFMWATWPMLPEALDTIRAWGFAYKTCAFSWMKADPYRLFADDATPFAGMGYWTRANTEPCLLATRGRPKRLAADVRQGIIAPRREHSRKPECVRERIERLVDGPYLELFARSRRPGWESWGNEVEKFGDAA